MNRQLEFTFDAPAPGDPIAEIARRERQRARNKAKCKRYYQRHRAARIQYAREYSAKNAEEISASKKGYYARNRESLRLKSARQRQIIGGNLEKAAAVRAYKQTWHQENRDRILARTKERRPALNQQYRERMKADPQFAMIRRLRRRMAKEIRRARGTKSRRTLALLGCSATRLKSFIETMLLPGMTWSNYGTKWVLDHRVPLSTFDLTEPTQQRLACHYTNLQPMWAVENLRKGKRLPHEHQFPLLMD